MWIMDRQSAPGSELTIWPVVLFHSRRNVEYIMVDFGDSG